MKSFLSPYPSNSVRELLYMTLPLTLSTLSGSFVLFFDRIVLARYSVEALEAAVASDAVAGVFSGAMLAFILSAETFVAVFNGSKRYQEIGPLIWQIMWICLASILFLAPLGYWCTPQLLAKAFEKEGIPYLRLLLYLNFLQPMIRGLSAFFVGRGKTRLVTFALLVANLVNGMLDVLFVFGYGWIPSMGAYGVALARGISWILQVIILGAFFFRKSCRETFATGQWYFSYSKFRSCTRIGGVATLFQVMESVIWAIFAQIIVPCGQQYAIIYIMGQNFGFLFAAFCQNLCRSVTTLAANSIGAGKEKVLLRLFRSTISVLVTFATCYALILTFWGKDIMRSFFKESEATLEISRLLYNLRPVYSLYQVADSFLWNFYGFLLAGNDVYYALSVKAYSVWLFIGIAYLLARLHFHPGLMETSLVAYLAFVAIFYGLRLKSGRWIKLRRDFE